MAKQCNGFWTKFPMTDADRSFLPYARQSIDEGDIAAVAAVLRGDWLTTGPKVKAFEETFAAKVGPGSPSVAAAARPGFISPPWRWPWAKAMQSWCRP